MNAAASRAERFLDYDKSLACIHCGLCLSSCPTYLETGNENDSPRGRIYLMRALQEGRVPLGDTAVRHLDLCLGCRACEAACPSGVPYGQLLEHTRDYIERHHPRGAFQTLLRRVLIERIFPFSGRLKLALLPARLLRRFHAGRFLPAFLRDTVSLLPDEMSSVSLPEVCPAASGPAQGRVGFISGCMMSVMFGDTNLSSVRLITRAGYEVITPPRQACCGALYAHSGNLERARDCARRNIALFERHQLAAIVINAAGCGSTLKEYGQLLRDDPTWAGRAARFSETVRDLTEWLAPNGFPASGSPTRAGNAGVSPAPFRRWNTRVTYHDACHLAHPQRITQPPRDLVRAVAGSHFVELPESDLCCGSAGSYNLTEPQMASRLQRRKIENIIRTGAQAVITTNLGCILQIQSGLRQAGADQVRVLHIADFLDQAMALETPRGSAAKPGGGAA